MKKLLTAFLSILILSPVFGADEVPPRITTEPLAPGIIKVDTTPPAIPDTIPKVSDNDNDTNTGSEDKAPVEKPQTKETPKTNDRLPLPFNEQRIFELEKNADAMRTAETSKANKLLDAASGGITGAGLSQMLQGAAEKRADERATTQINAVIQSFRCDTGGGISKRGGETGIMVGDGNALTRAVQDYVKLADELKITKAELGLPPGIESETIADKATSGLYDNASIGRGDNAFDTAADRLASGAAQNRINTGVALTAVGVVGGIVGDQIINRKVNEQSAEINAKYDALVRKLKSDMTNIKPKTVETPPVVEEEKTLETLPVTTAGVTVPNAGLGDASGVLPYVNILSDSHKSAPVKVFLGNSLFASGAVNVKAPEGEQNLDAVANALREFDRGVGADDNWTVTVTAYADRDRVKPGNKYGYRDNMQLTEMRAGSVIDYLVSRGIAREHFVPVAMGDTAATGKTAEEKNYDRRVEFGEPVIGENGAASLAAVTQMARAAVAQPQNFSASDMDLLTRFRGACSGDVEEAVNSDTPYSPEFGRTYTCWSPRATSCTQLAADLGTDKVSEHNRDDKNGCLLSLRY